MRTKCHLPGQPSSGQVSRVERGGRLAAQGTPGSFWKKGCYLFSVFHGLAGCHGWTWGRPGSSCLVKIKPALCLRWPGALRLKSATGHSLQGAACAVPGGGPPHPGLCVIPSQPSAKWHVQSRSFGKKNIFHLKRQILCSNQNNCQVFKICHS